MVLLPVALALLIGLSAFTLFSHRNAVELLLEERRAEAMRLARRLALRVEEGRSPGDVLRLYAPEAGGLAVVAADGAPLAAAGEPGAVLPPPAADSRRAVAVGPDSRLPDAVAAFTPLSAPPGAWLRVDVPLPLLAAQRRSLRLLTKVVLGADLAVGLLLLLFLRQLLAPFDRLMARARAVAPPRGPDDDELEHLLSTFESALAAEARRRAGDSEDELKAMGRTLTSSLESGLLLLDDGGEVLAVNPLGAELLGLPPAAAGGSLDGVLAAQPQLLSVLRRAVDGGGEVQREECVVSAPAGEITVGVTAHPLRRDDGSARGYLVLFADLTAARRQALEGRLADSLAELGELAAGVAHELRNSLATLSGYLDLARRRPQAEALAAELREMRREADHLRRVVTDFLSFARPGSARPQPLELSRLLRRAAADPTLSPVVVEVADPAADEPELIGDPELLSRAIGNLLHNAREAALAEGSAPPARIDAAVRADGRWLVLTVEDRGPGVPPEVRQRLFRPFVSGRAEGVGLGLAVSHRIVVMHGGSLALEDREGGGTRATVRLPAGEDVTIGNNPALPGSPGGSGGSA